ncbi:heparinase II/III family protein [Microlunatus elymi]|nr:heparinase II/III family protein [Microlunatus elymi]
MSDTATEAPPYALPDDTSLPYGRGELTGIFPPSRVRARLAGWEPFPKITDRAGWQAVPARVRNQTLARAEEALQAPWPELRASVFADFYRNGDRSRFELPHFERRKLLRDLVLGACLTDDQRFIDPIMDAVWSICEESFWGVAAHSFSRRHDQLPLPATDEPVIDLFAAETGAQLAWTRYLLGERLADAGGVAFDERVVAEIDRRLLTPFLERDDWHWLAKERTGANNWTPWVCSNLLVATLHTESDTDRRAVIVSKIIASLDVYVDQLLLDGGCSEGQSYWAVGPAKLIDCLDALYGASNGELNGFDVPKVAATSRYPVAMHVGGRRMIQHADGHGVWLLEGSVLHRAGRLLDDQQARDLAVQLRDAPGGRHERAKTNLWRGLSELFEPGFVDAPPTAAPLIKERWFGDLQVLVAREQEGSTDGFLLCMKAGNNAEHHNHNDVGGVSVAVDGHHLVIDPGVGVYSKKTFSPQRYELWEMNSDWHCLPIINGVVQSAGEQFAASSAEVDHDGNSVTMTAELAAAWPPEAGIHSYRRSATLDRDNHRIVVSDRWQGEGVTSLVLPLTLAVPPILDSDRISFDPGGRRVELAIDRAAEIAVEEKPQDDPNLRELWGERIWRLLITPAEPVSEGSLTLTFRL